MYNVSIFVFVTLNYRRHSNYIFKFIILFLQAQSKAVSEALLILWNKGLIYRDEALVNWSPQMRSTISDIEVNNIIVEGPTELSLPGYEKPVKFGEIVDIAYKVIGSGL